MAETRENSLDMRVRQSFVNWSFEPRLCQTYRAADQRHGGVAREILPFSKDYDKVDQDARTRNYEKAMEQLASKYPDDVEAR